MSIIIVLMLPLPKWLQSIIIFFLLTYGMIVIRRHGLLTAKSSVVTLKKAAATTNGKSSRVMVFTKVSYLAIAQLQPGFCTAI